MNEFLIESIKSGIIELLSPNCDILKESVSISFSYGLLPNDALIVATCKHYGIRKIATFDEDFRLIFLK
jgi:predicted nucleic acid-binding protein